MKETGRHQLAYQTYRSLLPGKRSMAKVAKEIGVSVRSVKKWAAEFNWKRRLEQDDRKLINRIEDETNINLMDIIKRQIQIGLKMQEQLMAKVESNSIHYESVNDFATLSKCLIPLAQLLSPSVEVEREYIAEFSTDNPFLTHCNNQVEAGQLSELSQSGNPMSERELPRF